MKNFVILALLALTSTLSITSSATSKPTLIVKETLVTALSPAPSGTHGTQSDTAPFGLFLQWSPDMKRVGYWADDESGMFLVVNGVAGKPFPAVDDGSPRGFFSPPDFDFTPDSKHFWYQAKRNGKWIVVVDGQESQPYDRVRDFVFSPDSDHYAFVAERNKTPLVVRDGKEGKRYHWIAPQDLHFSPDSQRMAYWAKLGNQNFTVLHDGATIKEFVFNPKLRTVNKTPAKPRGYSGRDRGKNTVERISRDGKEIFVVNGVESPPYDYLDSVTLSFGPDGQHYAHYGVSNEGKGFIVVDGVEIEKTYDVNPGTVLPSLIFDSPTSLRTLAMRNGKIFRVEIQIVE